MIDQGVQKNQLPNEMKSAFKELNMLKHLKTAGFRKKFGFTWVISLIYAAKVELVNYIPAEAVVIAMFWSKREMALQELYFPVQPFLFFCRGASDEAAGTDSGPTDTLGAADEAVGTDSGPTDTLGASDEAVGTDSGPTDTFGAADEAIGTDSGPTDTLGASDEAFP